jgi:PAS domain S-box-containing protein
MRILLIDDSAAYHEEFAYLLGEAGITMSVLDRASNAADGARLMTAGLHDVYFVDFRLPAENGLTLVEAVRKAGVNKPIIMLTAFDNPGVDAAAAQAGANDYLHKGEFSPQMLGRSIRYAVRNAAAVQAAREAESRFLMAQEAARIGTWDWDIRTNVFIWSPRQFAIFGLDPDAAGPVGYETWQRAIHPDDRDAVQTVVTAAMAGQRPLDTIFRILRPDSSDPQPVCAVRWVAVRGEVVRDASGAPLRMIGISIDVTDQQNALADLHSSRNRAVTDLKLSEARFQTYFENAAESLFHVRVTPDRDFVYEAVNPCGLAFAGMPLDRVRGRSPEEVLGPEKGGKTTEKLRLVCETGQPQRWEHSWTTGSGPVTFDAIYMPLRNDAGEITGILGSARDITERRRLEASLHQAQKMEALGQLAGGVAHDFKNLLNSILACFELLGELVTTDRAKRLLAEGNRAVQRGEALTARLLTFSRQQPLSVGPVDINASLAGMTELFAHTLGAGTQISRRLADGLSPAIADVNHIELAILNLVINARDAMPLGGSLVIETRNETIADAQNDDLAPGDYVVVAISDTGGGMTADVMAHALDPFFTTKAAGKGTGLGLSMVYGTVRQLGGGLRIDSEPGKGTRVTLYLPRAAAG